MRTLFGCCTKVAFCRFYSSATNRELQELFTDPKIHNLLRLITYNNPSLVHKPRFRQLSNDTIQMLTDKELKMTQQYCSMFSNQRLQMPPVLAKRDETTGGGVISKDAQLQGLLPRNYKLMFTDISLGGSNRTRLIVVREPDGVLRHATASERDRMNNVYFPTLGRQPRVPLMFQGQYLQNLLDRYQYLYVLERACNQFEPDDPDYIRVHHLVYRHIHERCWTPLNPVESNSSASNTINPLTLLRHTRHFGPLALYFISYLGAPGGLVYEALSSQHFARVGWILRLSALLRPSSSFAESLKSSCLGLPPPPEMDANSTLKENPELLLTSDDIRNILSYVQWFIDHEPLSDSQRQLLTIQARSCQDNLDVDLSDKGTG